jgi:hypothetical protein
MIISRVSVERPVFAIMISAAIIVVGWFSYRQLGEESRALIFRDGGQARLDSCGHVHLHGAGVAIQKLHLSLLDHVLAAAQRARGLGSAAAPARDHAHRWR